MSEIKWGLISGIDSETIMKTIDIICKECPGEVINTCEVGVYSGLSSRAIYEYVTSKQYGTTTSVPTQGMGIKNYECNHIGIDNGKDGEELRDFPKEGTFIKGNSNEVYNQIRDNSQHLIFIDGLHTFPAVVSDFFCYAPKVKTGGFLCFHDTGKHLDSLSGWQGVGDKNDPDMCLGGVRKALRAIGILDTTYTALEADGTFLEDWELIFDEADPNDTGGGVSIFRKI